MSYKNSEGKDNKRLDRVQEGQTTYDDYAALDDGNRYELAMQII